MKLTLRSLIFGTLIGLTTGPLLAVPEALTFHGRITVDNVNYTGSGEFRFALVNADGTVTYWSNDGTSADGSMPTASVTIEVSNGFYRVILGDETVANMTAIPSTAFETDDVRLRVWFDDGVNGAQQLAPDQPFTSVGYAMKAGSVEAGAISSEMIADGAISADKLAPEVLVIESDQLPTDPEFAGTVTADQFEGEAVKADSVEAQTLKAESIEGDGSGLTDLPVFDFNPTETRAHTAARMKVGGELGAARTQLEVEAKVAPGSRPENHVMLVKNTNPVPNANGIAVMLENEVNGAVDNSNNFMTFYDGEESIAGRIEGMSNDDIKLLARLIRELEETFTTSLGLFKFNLEIEQNDDWFDPGAFPEITLSGAEAPSITTEGGELPSIEFDRGALPNASFTSGALPKLDFSGGKLPSVDFNRGQLPSVSFSDGEKPSLTFSGGSLPGFNGASFSPGSLPSATLDPGALPTLTFDKGARPSLSLDRGSLPTAKFQSGKLPTLNFSNGRLPSLRLDPGSLPTITLDPGQLPTVEVSGGQLPSVNDLPIELKDLSIRLDEDAMARLLKEFGNDLDLLKKAWRMFHDPVCAAIVQSQIAFEGSGVTYESGSGDYAEWLERVDHSQELVAGDIVGVFGGKISKKTAGADQVLVVSHRPIVLGNMPAKSKELYEKVAFMGQVPVRVIGKVKKGDYIIPTGDADGTGRAVSPDEVTVAQLNKVVGVSWADSDIESIKYIKIIIGLGTNAYAKVFADQENEIDSLKTELNALKANVQEVAALEAKLDKVMALIGADKQVIVPVNAH